MGLGYFRGRLAPGINVGAIDGHGQFGAAFARARLRQQVIGTAKAVLGVAGYEKLKQQLFR
jgi:hypothetical protein